MNDKISKLQESVLIIEHISTIRFLYNDYFKKYGIQNIHGVSSIDEAIKFIEAEEVIWILSPIESKGKRNIFDLLKIPLNYPQRRKLLISALYDDPQLNKVGKIMEIGALSYHPHYSAKDYIEKEFEEFFELFSLMKGDTTLISAEYIRQYLTKTSNYQALLQLEKNLISLYPASAEVLMNMANALYLSGELDSSIMTLEQVKLINPKLKNQCERLENKFSGGSRSDQTPNTRIENYIGIDQCVIVDPDHDSVFNIKKLLNSIGVENIISFEDGESFGFWLDSNEEPGLILMEWKIPKLSGPILSQRIRGKGFHSVPIIIVSSLLDEAGSHLNRELGINSVIKKPFESDTFYKQLIWTIQQFRRPTEQKCLESKILNLLNGSNFSEGERLIYNYMSDKRINNLSKKKVMAIYHFHQNNFQECKDLGLQIIDQLENSKLLMLSYMGKSFLKLEDYESALACFEQAQKMSPQNYCRLFEMAEASYKNGDNDSACKQAEEAYLIDPTNPEVQQQSSEILTTCGNLKLAKKILSELQNGDSYLINMNNLAVSMARTGKFEEGIKLYEKTLSVLPEKFSHFKDKILYNLALAHARYGNLEESLNVIEENLDVPESEIYVKASSLKRKLIRCISNSEKLTLSGNFQEAEVDGSIENTHDSNPSSAQNNEKPMVSNEDFIHSLGNKLSISKGQICCYLIFRENEDGELDNIESLSDFKLRKKIIK